jgi:hypothetical protein
MVSPVIPNGFCKFTVNARPEPPVVPWVPVPANVEIIFVVELIRRNRKFE